MTLNFVLSALCGALFLTACNSPPEKVKSFTASPYLTLKNTLCDKRVVLLGEGSSHDEGATIDFKSRMARDLIQDCGFSLLVFESSFYQFVELNRKLSEGNEVSREAIETSIGWLWRNQVDIDPLLEILPDVVNAKRVIIAGMDDQISGRGQNYANFDLPIELTLGLDSELRKTCIEALNWRVLQAFTKGNHYDGAKKKFILSCLESSDDSEDEQIAAMRASLIKDFQRDLLGHKEQFAGRGRSMYSNFEYWFDYAGKPKTIIWSSTTHAVKIGPANTGELLHKRFDDDAYALGFSALSGLGVVQVVNHKLCPKPPILQLRP